MSMEANDPWSVANFIAHDMNGRIYVVDLYDYISCMPHGFREDFCLKFSHYKSIEAYGSKAFIAPIHKV